MHLPLPNRQPAAPTRFVPALIAMAISLCSLLGQNSFPVDPATNGVSGVWKWGWTTPAGQTIDHTARITQEGTRIDGHLLGPNNTQWPIKNGLADSNTIRFEVSRDLHGTPVLYRYEGRLQGDHITGLLSWERDGELRNREWDALKQTNSPPPARRGTIEGAWKYTVKTETGEGIDLTVRFKRDGRNLTGINRVLDNDIPIQDGTIEEGRVRFKVVNQYEGRTITTTYDGRVVGDTLRGTLESDFTGQRKTYDWLARRP